MARRTVDTERTGESVQRELDDLSLRQALLDFEVANARVVDLTQRLIEATATLNEYRAEVDHLRIEHAEHIRREERLRRSRLFRLAEKFWAMRKAVGI